MKQEKNTHVYFLCKGLVRSYKVNEKGDEITVALYLENPFFLNAECHLYQTDSTFYFECLQPLLGDIIINTDYGLDDYFDARNFEVIDVATL